MNSIKNAWLRFWYAQNYAYCKSNEYLAMHQDKLLESADWGSRASHWEREYQMLGRSLRG